MPGNEEYQPPFTITSAIVNLVADISENLGGFPTHSESAESLRLRRENRIRTIQGSLAIEGNTLNEDQISAILDGKRVIAPPREIQEARNAIDAYDFLEHWHPKKEKDLLKAHKILMKSLIDDAGAYRRSGVGVVSGEQVVHMAPPAGRIPELMHQLLKWLGESNDHPLISSSVFHYEFEFIHPFADGNGRLGRLWQTLILSKWNPVFSFIPVENLVHQNQAGYYEALQQSSARADSTPFIEFMLKMILDSFTPQVEPQVTPQVRKILRVLLSGEMSRKSLQEVLQLRDRKSFQQRYLKPSLADGFIELTIPDKPNSRLQRYRITEKGRKVIC